MHCREHNPYDIRALRDCLQYMLNRRQLVQGGTLAPAVTPMVRIPPNGGEQAQWQAKQVLDLGAYGIIWPHISRVEEAYNAVARLKTAERYDPPASAATGRPRRCATGG
jgi:4-hydroxy-2-oxoheptanedioate aldolase